MVKHMMPFSRTVNLRDGTIIDPVAVTKRTLADLKGLFADTAAEDALLAQNPLIYEVYEATENPAVVGQLRYSTTVIYPGKVGDEYFMTKGITMRWAIAPSFTTGCWEGYLLLQSPDGEINVQHMTPGVAAYVPPYWGHRTINIGTENFAFLPFTLLMQAMTMKPSPSAASLP